MANNAAKAKMIYKDAHAPLENRVEDLLSRMTLKEKVLQLNQYSPSQGEQYIRPTI